MMTSERPRSKNILFVSKLSVAATGASIMGAIFLKSASRRGIAEEAPGVYKDVDAVVQIAHNSGIARKVARLCPLGVVKG